MVHLWLRAEARPTERRTPLSPTGAAHLIGAGFEITVETSPMRVVPDADFATVGCRIVPAGSWREAPMDAFILGLKELPEEETPLRHRHIMFAHAYKGQPGAAAVLMRFREGGGTLYDIEYLTEADGRRVVAFGYYAGFVGAAVTLLGLAAQRRGERLTPLAPWVSSEALCDAVEAAIGPAVPDTLIVGAKGRVGTGASDLLSRVGVTSQTLWDIEETAHGGPFPEILDREVFINGILAGPGAPVFVPPEAASGRRRLRMIGDVACDPGSPYNPVPLYDAPTSWEAPVLDVARDPPLGIMAIDNLPSLLPRESSDEFADQFLPHLETLKAPGAGIWGRAADVFAEHVAGLDQ